VTEQKNTSEGLSHGFLLNEARQAISQRLAKVKHKVIVLSGKGGVGKSTVAVNMACALSALGKKVGLLEVDLHGPTVPIMMGLNDKPIATDEGIHPLVAPWGTQVISLGNFLPQQDDAVIWRGPMKMGAIRQFLADVVWGELDYLIIDCPPGTGDEPLSLVQLITNPDGAVIVTTPQEVALAAVRKSVSFTQKVGLKLLGIVENFAGYHCPHCNQESFPFSQGGGQSVSNFANTQLLVSIPIFPDMVARADAGKPIGLDPTHPAGKIYRTLVEKIDGQLQ